MPVDVDITVFCPILHKRRLLGHFDATGLGDRAIFITHIVGDAPSVKSQQIGRFTSFHTYHRPHRTGIAHCIPLVVKNGKVTVGKKAINILHPRLNTERLILARHLLQLNSQTGKYPCIMVLIQCGNTESTVGGMKSGTIQQMIPQYTHCQFSGEIAMKRLCHKLVRSNFIVTHYSSFLSFC